VSNYSDNMGDKMRGLVTLLITLAAQENDKHQYSIAEVSYAFSTAPGCICIVNNPMENLTLTKLDGVVN
jgi:hypothetical protein